MIPDNIEHIQNNAFTGCLNLEKAELPENLTYIPGDMFFFCAGLSDVVIHGELQRIGYGAFNECTSLKEFTIPDTVTKIGWRAFENAGCTENIDGLLYVQDWLVGSDPKIETAVIRDGTLGIAERSMTFMKNVTLVDIPPSVKYPGDAVYIGIPSATHSVMHYRARTLPERTIATNKCSTDIYIHDPFCEIFDSEKTISPIYRYYVKEDSGDRLIQNEVLMEDALVIHGYANSTAQAYAEKYSRQFETIKPSGDVNADGAFNISDVVLLQKWLLADPDTHLADWKAADMCEDNRLDVFDLCLMKHELLNKINAQNG